MVDTLHPRTMAAHMPFLNGELIRGMVSMADAIENQREALASVGQPEVSLAPRTLLTPSSSLTAFSYLAQHRPRGVLVAKVGTVVPGNRERGLPTVSALVLALDGTTGTFRAVLDGEAVTTLRTVAASVAVARELQPHPKKVAVIGAGTQGRAHLAAALDFLDPEAAVIYGKSSVDARGLPRDPRVRIATSATDAVSGADVVFTCTNSSQPVLAAVGIDEGAVVISVGSFAPEKSEVGNDLLRRAAVFVDDVETSFIQAGPIVRALASGDIHTRDIRAIGERLRGQQVPVRPGTDVIFYNSVGIGVQDAAIVDLILARAEASGMVEVASW